MLAIVVKNLIKEQKSQLMNKQPVLLANKLSTFINLNMMKIVDEIPYFNSANEVFSMI